MKSYKLQILVAFMIGMILCTVEVMAKNLFVSTAGDDGVSYLNNNINSPWRTAEKAFSEVLQPGDNVYFRGGVYTMASGIIQSGSGDGTATDPITFSSHESESVTIRGSVIRQIYVERNYQQVNGITFYSSGTFFEVGWNTDATNFKATNCTFYNDTEGGGVNVGSIVFRSNNARNGYVSNCKFYGPGEYSNMNTAGVFAFRAQGLKVFNNEFYQNNNGIFYKHTCVGYDTGIEFAYNYFDSSLSVGIRSVSQYTAIHDNLFNGAMYVSGQDGGFGDDGTNAGSDYNVIYHNTFHNTYAYLVLGSGDGAYRNTFRDNIFTQVTQLHPYNSSSHDSTTNYNLYPNGNIVLENKVYYDLVRWPVRNLGDANSIAGTAVFVSGTSPSTISGYALTASSPGYRASSDGKDLGADVTLIGVSSTRGETPPSPEKPSIVEGFILSAFGQPQTNLSTECLDYNNLHPEWIFCDDFESEAPLKSDGRYFEYKDDDGDFIQQPAVGVEGSRGMRVVWQSGEVDAGNLALGFGRNPSSYMDTDIHSTEDFREIYYRMYLKNEAGWEGSPYKLSRASVISSSDWSQAMIAHLWASNTGDNTLAMDPASCVVNGVVQCSGWNDFNNLEWLGKKTGVTPIFSTEQAGQWKCVEVHVKLNDPGQSNGIHEFWIDGELQARSADLNFTGTYTEYGLNYLAFENYWNSGSPKEQKRYFDNIVVSTAPIGCQ